MAETAFITVGGKQLEVKAWGPPPHTAPVLVLLHEGLGCVALWRDFPPLLAEATGCRVVAYSRAGYGRSDPVTLPRPLDYMTREAVETLPQVLDAIDFERGMLVGHSDGASIAAIHAGEIRDPRVAAIVLMAPHFFTEPGGLASIAEAKAAYETGGLRDRLAKYHADVDVAFRGWNDAWLDPGFKAWNIEDVIDRWQVPALALQGAADQYGTLAQIGAIERRAKVPVETVILDGCRHAPYLEAPDRTLQAIARFCARTLAGSR
ncbi:MAG: alpha/beta hydrolase [Nitratireductor sp.]|nr:alpha/beta hydrolase [Nitratireductor sp.]